MEVGDSIFIEGKTSDRSGSLYAYLKPKKFSSRKWEQDGKSGVRGWRIA
jgi:hypothetical protein